MDLPISRNDFRRFLQRNYLTLFHPGTSMSCPLAIYVRNLAIKHGGGPAVLYAGVGADSYIINYADADHTIVGKLPGWAVEFVRLIDHTYSGKPRKASGYACLRLLDSIAYFKAGRLKRLELWARRLRRNLRDLVGAGWTLSHETEDSAVPGWPKMTWRGFSIRWGLLWIKTVDEPNEGDLSYVEVHGIGLHPFCGLILPGRPFKDVV